MARDERPESRREGRKITRRRFLFGLPLVLGGIMAGLGTSTASPDQGERLAPFQTTEFDKKISQVAEKLGWSVQTVPEIEMYGANPCLVYHNDKNWTGCVEVFDGFSPPQRDADFKPAAYLVLAWRGSDYDHHLIVVQPKDDLPAASGEFASGRLHNTPEEQKTAAEKFGFAYPQDQFSLIDPEVIGPIGYWALSRDELQKIDFSDMILP